MSKVKIGTNPKKAPSIPGTSYSRPSGSCFFATFDSPEALSYAVNYGNRPTRRLAENKLGISKHRKLMKSIGGDL